MEIEIFKKDGFVEVETPIFQNNPCGASANPFKTHHNAMNLDMYLRISPETFLKRLIVGGMEKIFEIGKNFRNEGIDPSHLKFTMLSVMWHIGIIKTTYFHQRPKEVIKNIDHCKNTGIIRFGWTSSRVGFKDLELRCWLNQPVDFEKFRTIDLGSKPSARNDISCIKIYPRPSPPVILVHHPDHFSLLYNIRQAVVDLSDIVNG